MHDFCPPPVFFQDSGCIHAPMEWRAGRPMVAITSLYSFLPSEPPASQNYSVRPRVHNLQLPDHANHISLTVTLSDRADAV